MFSSLINVSFYTFVGINLANFPSTKVKSTTVFTMLSTKRKLGCYFYRLIKFENKIHLNPFKTRKKFLVEALAGVTGANLKYVPPTPQYRQRVSMRFPLLLEIHSQNHRYIRCWNRILVSSEYSVKSKF